MNDEWSFSLWPLCCCDRAGMWNYHSYRDRTDGNSSIKALRTVGGRCGSQANGFTQHILTREVARLSFRFRLNLLVLTEH